MKKPNKKAYFWTSYSDLMTNLFFIMLVLFVLAIALLHREIRDIEIERNLIEKERNATQAELLKINEIREAIQNIDTTYFEYNPEYKKHILKTVVKFKVGSSNIDDLDEKIKKELMDVKGTISKFLGELVQKDKNASYLLVIEGQASKDDYYLNNQLSYERALALFKYWFPESNSLSFGDFPCEIVIAGAGFWDGKPRSNINDENQRFLIQIMPKPGLIDIDK